ncbi:MAG: hypothetical protein ABFC38_12250 [Methanospirillum sp.]
MALPQEVGIAVSAQQQGDDIVMMYQGGQDSPSLHALTVTGTEADGMAISGSFANTPPAVGDILTLTGVGNAGGDHMVVAAGLAACSRRVILDTVV